MSNWDKAGQGWRLVGEITQPSGFQDEQWVAVGVTAALDGMRVLLPDLERVKKAAVAAVERTVGCWTTRASMAQPLIVRVLISTATGDRIARHGWGFFIIERATGEMDSTDAKLERVAARPMGHCIELYLYADAGSP